MTKNVERASQPPLQLLHAQCHGAGPAAPRERPPRFIHSPLLLLIVYVVRLGLAGAVIIYIYNPV